MYSATKFDTRSQWKIAKCDQKRHKQLSFMVLLKAGNNKVQEGECREYSCSSQRQSCQSFLISGGKVTGFWKITEISSDWKELRKWEGVKARMYLKMRRISRTRCSRIEHGRDPNYNVTTFCSIMLHLSLSCHKKLHTVSQHFLMCHVSTIFE